LFDFVIALVHIEIIFDFFDSAYKFQPVMQGVDLMEYRILWLVLLVLLIFVFLRDFYAHFEDIEPLHLVFQEIL